MKKEIPGILSVIGGDSGDMFDSVLSVPSEKANDSSNNSSLQEDIVTPPDIADNAAADIKPKEDEQKQSTAYILATALKESGLDIGDIEQNISLADFTKKIESHLESKAEAKAKELYGVDTIEAAKMLNSGMSLEDRSEYARLNVLANHKYEVTEDMPDEDRAAVTADAKEVIKEYYSEKLTGKALQRAIDGIDEFDEGFADEYKTASDHFKGRRDELKSSMLKTISDEESKTRSYEDNMRKAIEDGSVFGDKKMSKEEISRAVKNMYEPTEEIEINGEKKMVSKYIKTAYELKNNPLLGAKLALIVAEGLTLDTPKNIGKGDFASELEKKLQEAADFPGRSGAAVVGSKKPLNSIKGILEVLD